MKHLISLSTLLIFLFACKPDLSKIQQQELEYDRIADSVLNSNLPDKDTTLNTETDSSVLKTGVN